MKKLTEEMKNKHARDFGSETCQSCSKIQRLDFYNLLSYADSKLSGRKI